MEPRPSCRKTSTGLPFAPSPIHSYASERPAARTVGMRFELSTRWIIGRHAFHRLAGAACDARAVVGNWIVARAVRDDIAPGIATVGRLIIVLAILRPSPRAVCARSCASCAETGKSSPVSDSPAADSISGCRVSAFTTRRRPAEFSISR